MPINPLFAFTRFYKGPDTEPDTKENNERLIWDYERMWVQRDEMRDESSAMVREYIDDVLPLWSEEDGIPLSLKALLYNRYSHWLGGYGLESDVAGFKHFIKRDYLRLDFLEE